MSHRKPRTLAVLATLLLAAGAVHAADKLRWKVPNAFPSHLPALGDNVQLVADMLKGASDGQIQFKIFEPGNLVPPLELSDAVRDKTIDAGYTWLGYDAGKIPAAPLFSARPFGMEPWEYTSWWYEGGGRQLAEDMGVDVEFVPTAWDGIIPALVAGKFDVIISGMSITAERNLTVNFSDP